MALRAASGVHAEKLIVLRLSRTPGLAHEVVYNAPLMLAVKVIGKFQSNGQAQLRLSHLRVMNKQVEPRDRVAER